MLLDSHWYRFVIGACDRATHALFSSIGNHNGNFSSSFPNSSDMLKFSYNSATASSLYLSSSGQRRLRLGSAYLMVLIRLLSMRCLHMLVGSPPMHYSHMGGTP